MSDRDVTHWPDDVYLIPAEQTRPGHRLRKEHQAAVARLARARDELEQLQREDEALYNELRAGKFGDGIHEVPHADEKRERRLALADEIRAQVDEIRERERQAEDLARRLRTEFIPVRRGRHPELPTEDGVQR